MVRHSTVYLLPLVLFACSSPARSQTWFTVTTPQFATGSVALQLTDGTIMVQQSGSSNWPVPRRRTVRSLQQREVVGDAANAHWVCA